MQITFTKRIFLLLLLLANLFAAYAGHFNNSFHFDDFHSIQDNLYLRSLNNLPLFFSDPQTISTRPANQVYRPLITSTLAFDYWLGNGLEPFYFHVTQFSFFCICVLFVYLFFRYALQSQAEPWREYLAFFACYLFACHTAIAETVNYISARSDILSTLAVVLGFCGFAQAGFIRRSYLYLLPVAAGMLAKEQAAMFASLLFAYVLIIEQKLETTEVFSRQLLVKVKSTFLTCLPAILLCSLLLFISMQKATSFHPGGSDRIAYLLTQPFVMLDYFCTFFWPMHLNADTDWELVKNAEDPRIYWGAAFICIQLLIIFKTLKNSASRPIAFGLIWFFLALLPTSSIIPLAEVKNDHRLFFPYIGLALAAAVSLKILIFDQLTQPLSRPLRYFVNLALAGLLIAHLIGVQFRTLAWKSEETLWYDVTLKSPNNARGLMNFGVSQMAKGNYPVAEDYFQRALSIKPSYQTIHINLGVLYGITGRPVQAERHFRSALLLANQDPGSYYYYAQWLSRLNRDAEALQLALTGNRLAPGHLQTLYLLLEINKKLGAKAERQKFAEIILQLNPKDPKALAALLELKES